MTFASLCCGLFAPCSAFAGRIFYSGGSLTMALAPFERSPVGDPFPVEAARANGYLLGVADAFSGIGWCPADGVNDIALRNVVYKALKAHPESHKQAAAPLVRAALQQEWPCAAQAP